MSAHYQVMASVHNSSVLVGQKQPMQCGYSGV